MDTSTLPVEALESLRLRLSHLAHWLNHLQAGVQQPTLPSRPNLHQKFTIVLKQLTFLSLTLSQHHDILSTTTAYPLPSFPLQTEPTLAPTLLRKKPEPEVEEWLAAGRAAGAAGGGTRVRDSDENWMWAREIVNGEREQRAWDGLYTADEIVSGHAERAEAAAEPRAAAADEELTAEHVLRYMYQGVDVHEPMRKVTNVRPGPISAGVRK
ncbi:mediator of RNA polymerase II transcription complex subunit 8-domain-containing protein [Dipodascopsis tothii]|uniref:mediator of RNA polymerase II transcription complex subunit 8-domain-containing protein n=1 Tax=Dipodascopsis tothii TaxID=44089 RepID=UPI0034CFB6E1